MRNVRAAGAHAFEPDCMACARRVAALHPLEDHVVARLQRQVDVRH
jgi:hypothetical protein